MEFFLILFSSIQSRLKRRNENSHFLTIWNEIIAVIATFLNQQKTLVFVLLQVLFIYKEQVSRKSVEEVEQR